MGKIVFWLVVFFVALLVLRLVNGRARSDAPPRERGRRRDTSTVRCVNCGVYLPKADAIAGPRGPVCGDPQCLPAGTRAKR
jgi:hypothetical protein